MPHGIDVELSGPYANLDIATAIWKECTVNAPLTLGQVIEVYGTQLTVTQILPSEIILVDPKDNNRAWSVPSWRWASQGA